MFDSLCHNLTEIINEIVNEIEMQEWKSPPQAKICTAFVAVAHKYFNSGALIVYKKILPGEENGQMALT